MNPALIAGIVEGFGALAGMAAKLISAPDPAAVLADMRAELEKMHGKIGPGGTLDQTIAANNAALDAAIAAEEAKQAAPNPTVLTSAEEVTKS